MLDSQPTNPGGRAQLASSFASSAGPVRSGPSRGTSVGGAFAFSAALIVI
jgi:hypothetical protein